MHKPGDRRRRHDVLSLVNTGVEVDKKSPLIFFVVVDFLSSVLATKSRRRRFVVFDVVFDDSVDEPLDVAEQSVTVPLCRTLVVYMSVYVMLCVFASGNRVSRNRRSIKVSDVLTCLASLNDTALVRCF